MAWPMFRLSKQQMLLELEMRYGTTEYFRYISKQSVEYITNNNGNEQFCNTPAIRNNSEMVCSYNNSRTMAPY